MVKKIDIEISRASAGGPMSYLQEAHKKEMDSKKALKKEPKNLAYLDTLAWGEYKLNNCAEAYIQMKKVVDEAGLEDKEIRLHWEKIKECVK